MGGLGYHGCLDTTIGAAATVGTGHLAKPKIDIQLKATRQQNVEREEYVSWTLDIKHYDSLRAPAIAPHLLVVLLLPDDVEESIEHTAEQLVLRRCAYWVMMTGMDAAPAGQQTRTVRLPKSQLFSPGALTVLMEKVSRRELP